MNILWLKGVRSLIDRERRCEYEKAEDENEFWVWEARSRDTHGVVSMPSTWLLNLIPHERNWGSWEVGTYQAGAAKA